MNPFPVSFRATAVGMLLTVATISSAATVPELPRGLHLSLYGRATYEDNSTRSDTDKSGETYFATGLSLAYQRSGAMADVSLSGSVGYQRSLRDPAGSGLVYSVSPTITIDDGAWQFTFAGSASRQSGTADASLANTQSTLCTNVDFAAGARLAVSERLRLAANVGYATVIFDDSTFADYGQDTVTVDFSPYYVLSSSVNVGARVGHTWITYQDDTRPAVESNQLGVFATYEITDKLKSHAGIGVEWVDVPSTVATDSSAANSWYLDAGLDYAINARLDAALTISHGVEASYSLASEYRTADSVGLSFDYRVNRNLQLTTLFRYVLTDADTGVQATEFLYSLGTVYRFTDYLSVEAGYSFDHYDSAGNGFVNNTCYFGVRTSL